jgi:3-hydroxyacyl-[acyl-carrier-protein] dehydratase
MEMALDEHSSTPAPLPQQAGIGLAGNPGAAAPVKTTLDIVEIQRILPHRYPFLLIDRIVDLVPKRRIVALKNITANEPFFQGHFPGYPIMPGVLVIEAMAQAGATLLLGELEDRANRLAVFTGIERARFRRPVGPGDQLRLEVEVVAWRHAAGRMSGVAFVSDKRVAEATISCHVIARASAWSPDSSAGMGS